MYGACACDSLREDLSSFSNESLQSFNVFVIYLSVFICAELADLLLSEAAASASSFVVHLDNLLSLEWYIVVRDLLEFRWYCRRLLRSSASAFLYRLAARWGTGVIIPAA